MYMEIFKNRILDNNPVEIYEAVRDHGQSEVKELLNTLKENNTFNKRRKLNAVKETREIYDKMTPNEQEHEVIIMNDGCLIDPRNNNGEIRCAICGVKLSSINECHFDHILPFAKGGKSTVDNCQILCISCNLKKNDKDASSAERIRLKALEMQSFKDKAKDLLNKAAIN